MPRDHAGSVPEVLKYTVSLIKQLHGLNELTEVQFTQVCFFFWHVINFMKRVGMSRELNLISEKFHWDLFKIGVVHMQQGKSKVKDIYKNSMYQGEH